MTNRIAIALICGAGASAGAQPATEIRFANGTNAITVEPGAAVPVTVYATGLPLVGTQIPWTTAPGTGQLGYYQGFASTVMNVIATSGTWSGLAIAPPLLPGSPWGSPGTAAGSSVWGINATVGFNQPVTGQAVALWHGTLTVGDSDVALSTAMMPMWNPPVMGFEVQISVPPLAINVTHFFPVTDGTAVITVPSPSAVVLIGSGVLLCAQRRRRECSECRAC